MIFCPVNFPSRRLFLAAILCAAMSAAAQQTIQFTKPVDQDLSKANAFKPANDLRNAGAFNAPSSLFGDNNPTVNFDILPGSPNPNANAASAAQWQKFLEGKKNWTLMTPEEVLGIPTPEKILGITNPKDDPNLSAEERFLQRRDRLADNAATNSLNRPDSGYWRGDKEADSFRSWDAGGRSVKFLDGSAPGSAKNLNFNPLFAPDLNSPADAVQKSASAWSNPFGMPAALPKPTPDQLAGMERFRALMEPAAPEKTVEAPRFSYQPASAPDRNFEALPAFNPAGRSFSTLQSGITKPRGITALQDVSGPRPSSIKKSSSLTQPPPWLQSTPESFVPVQRQF